MTSYLFTYQTRIFKGITRRTAHYLMCYTCLVFLPIPCYFPYHNPTLKNLILIVIDLFYGLGNNKKVSQGEEANFQHVKRSHQYQRTYLSPTYLYQYYIL